MQKIIPTTIKKVTACNIEKENLMLLSVNFKQLKIARKENEYVATLVDLQGYEIVRGYGKTVLEAINQLHRTLI